MIMMTHREGQFILRQSFISVYSSPASVRVLCVHIKNSKQDAYMKTILYTLLKNIYKKIMKCPALAHIYYL